MASRNCTTDSRSSRTNALILDLGCGPAHDAAELAKRELHAIGCDPTRGLLLEARHHEAVKGGLLQADARELPLASGVIDGIWACASLLHLRKTDTPKALGEAFRVIKPGGVLFTSMQQGSGELVPYDPGFGFPVRMYFFYLADEWDALVKAAVFEVIDKRVNPTTYGLTQGATGWIETFARKP